MTDPLELIAAGVRALVEQDPHSLPDTLLLTSTETIFTVMNQLSGVAASRLQVMDVRDVTVAECGRQTRSWLVEEQHLGQEDASRYMTVAKALPTCPEIGPALLAGDITIDHARVIAIGVRKVPAEIREVFEKELVKAAASCDPTELARFARELRSRLGADESAEAAAQRKYDSRWVTITPTFDGMHSIAGMLDPASAATVRAALAPLLERAGDIDERTVGQRCADGLVSLAELAMRTGQLPDHGGEKPQLVALLPFSDLMNDLETGHSGLATLNGFDITPRTARMIACDAGIIPAVLGSHGEVLDLGRKQPTWSLAQRRALRIEDGGCRFPGCQAGLDRCRIHHIDHWAHGGRTDISNGVHVCLFHHWLIHHSNWQISKDHMGRVRVWRT
jgi:Domain of unknown function (DUF222)